MDEKYIDMACISAIVKLQNKQTKKMKSIKNKLYTNLSCEDTKESHIIDDNIFKFRKSSPLLVSPLTNRNSCRRSAIMETDVIDRALVKKSVKEYMKLKCLHYYGIMT